MIQHPALKETVAHLEEAVEKTILDLTELIDVMKDQVFVNKLDELSSIVTATSELYKAYKTYNQ
ncbi:hypothetical protein BK716_19660 [Bacillus thuringiensis serovar higo]|uniref:Uncharacterized protein n=1 Tax=Bacillus thuringiensis subsp. higo TaxID=132266 RepID=A0A9X6LIU8_BACUH|nr:hypothetical protein BK716_20495 [Bacillus thuringiensis serovar higo]OUB47116.1 hypothetical protein BK716_20480 [Bacillus thuringiensis serovar higo]OUB47149.1 hypothetical protein BK716_20440 [Bacillus thuringiensis serovar higo]OUB48231.1 hypothetical protein BK716_19660 [Bacillus thuringiensis serovar higo]